MMTKKVLNNGSIEITRLYHDNKPTGTITIKDRLNGEVICLYAEEAAYLSEALKEILNFIPEKS